MESLKSHLEIRTAIFDDIPIIQDIAQQTWPITYGGIISRVQIVYMLDLMYSTETLEKQMFQEQIFLIADVGNNPIGFASFRVIEDSVYKLDKLYILPNAQNIGVGKKLLLEGIKRVINVGGKELQLQVNRKNEAVGFYKKMGFVVIRQENFNIGDGYYMNDYIMSLIL